jgi:hypothetical protein
VRPPWTERNGDTVSEQTQQDPATATAVETEVARIIRAAEAEAGRTYRADVLRPYAYKILRETVPGFTRERWREITNRDADTRYDPEDARLRREAELARAREAREARQYLLDHGQEVCCPEHDVAAAARHREAPVPPPMNPVPPPIEEEEEEEEEPGCEHGSVSCRECGGTGCGGFDRWGDPRDCDTSCPHCDRCGASHECRNCGLDPDCDHEWRCQDCAEDVEWQRDHWEIT